MKTRKGIGLIVAIPLLIFLVCAVLSFSTTLILGSKTKEYVDQLPVDEMTGIRSWARIYWLGGGMFEANISTSDTTPGEQYNDWSLKLVVPKAVLTTHFHESADRESGESGSSVGFLYLNEELSGDGVFIFDPQFPQFLFLPWIEHNFGFEGVSVDPTMDLKMFIVLHLPEGDREIPIHIPGLVRNEDVVE